MTPSFVRLPEIIIYSTSIRSLIPSGHWPFYTLNIIALTLIGMPSFQPERVGKLRLEQASALTWLSQLPQALVLGGLGAAIKPRSASVGAQWTTRSRVSSGPSPSGVLSGVSAGHPLLTRLATAFPAPSGGRQDVTIARDAPTPTCSGSGQTGGGGAPADTSVPGVASRPGEFGEVGGDAGAKCNPDDDIIASQQREIERYKALLEQRNAPVAHVAANVASATSADRVIFDSINVAGDDQVKHRVILEQALAFTQMTISPEYASRYTYANSAQEIYDDVVAWTKLYATQHVFSLHDQLRTMSMLSTESPTSWFDRMRIVAEKLSEGGFVVAESDVIELTVLGITHRRFDCIRQQAFAMSKTHTFYEVCELFEATDRQNMRMNSSNVNFPQYLKSALPGLTPPTAPYAGFLATDLPGRGRGRGAGNRGRGRNPATDHLMCSYCHRRGHVSETCYTRFPALRGGRGGRRGGGRSGGGGRGAPSTAGTAPTREEFDALAATMAGLAYM